MSTGIGKTQVSDAGISALNHNNTPLNSGRGWRYVFTSASVAITTILSQGGLSNLGGSGGNPGGNFPPSGSNPAAYTIGNASATGDTFTTGIQDSGTGTGSLAAFLTRLIRMSFNVRKQTATTCRTWVGLFDTTATINANGGTQLFKDNPLFKMIAFRCSGAENWKAYVCDGTTATIVDTGVANDVNNFQLLEFTYNSVTKALTFFINGVAVCTITTNIPALTTQFSFIMTTDNIGVAIFKPLSFSSAMLQESF